MKILIMLLMLTLSCLALAQGNEDTAAKIPIVSIAEVPPIVASAARKARPGAFFKHAERSYWNDEPIYIVTGSEFSREWKVYVSSRGQVKHISSEILDSED
ncbi:MAG: hypothetical protein ACJA09_000312 [Alcanivorax sp.]|jgi:hypothetical protein